MFKALGPEMRGLYLTLYSLLPLTLHPLAPHPHLWPSSKRDLFSLSPRVGLPSLCEHLSTAPNASQPGSN